VNGSGGAMPNASISLEHNINPSLLVDSLACFPPIRLHDFTQNFVYSLALLHRVAFVEGTTSFQFSISFGLNHAIFAATIVTSSTILNSKQYGTL